jgi:RecA-family ATPase
LANKRYEGNATKPTPPAVRGTSPYLIESILPRNEIHLIAGPTGAGKTTLLFQMLLEWEKGRDVFGFASHPVPWAYVAADRKIRSTEATLKRMGIREGAIKMIPARDEKMTAARILDACAEVGARLIVWENFGSFPEQPCRHAQVKHFLFGLDPFVERDDLTIIGVMEETKMKQRDKYENPRQRISGVATWGHLCDTIFIIEPSNLEDPSNARRVLYICPRNTAGLKLNLEMQSDGRLHDVPIDPLGDD